ncbi:MAG: trypsin-like peptidase domain-containing protein [Desulfobacteraceae bacterium]|nr:trypsin-like peptidase domain-containing protein [Desulfobacteraceae bacterium]
MFKSKFGWIRLAWMMAVVAVVFFPRMALSGDRIEILRRGVVRIYAVAQVPDYLVPWAPGNSQEGWGTGFIISRNRLLTNAHVVSNARFITIEKEGDSRRYEAQVKFIAHDCDLAMLEVVDESFFKGTAALKLGGVPALDSVVTVLGYPIGGDRLSVTRGVVSRIDYRGYAHSGVDSHLVVQIDAAINPGNSGGPVFQDNVVVGMAFQGFSGMVAQNVGYMIPTPVMNRFLEDVADGHYDSYVDVGFQYFPLINATHRRALGLAPGDYGVMVGEVMRAGAAYGYLQTGDVLLSIDDHVIFSDGRVDLDNDRLMLNEVVERKFKGDTVRLKLLRQGQEMKVTMPLNTPWPYLMQANQYDEHPRFVVFGGLLFQPLSNEFYEALNSKSVTLRYYYSQFLEEELYLEHPEVVVISKVFPDPSTSYLEGFATSIVDSVNDVKIRTLAQLKAAFEAPAEFYVIRLVGDPQPLVLEAKAAKEARDRILKQYGITQEAYLPGGIVPPGWAVEK